MGRSDSSPRLVVTDALGRRIVPIATPVFSIGRRTEADLKLNNAGVSRLHAEVVTDGHSRSIRDCGSRFGTFVNDERITADRLLQSGDHLRFGQSSDTEIVFVTGDDPSSAAQSATAAATTLRQMAALLEGLRAIGSGRALDDVLALVLDSAIDVTGAERGFIMLANRDGQLEFKLARARGRLTLSGRTFETSQKIPAQVFSTGCETFVEDLLDNEVARLHTGTVGLGIRHVLCTPLRLVRHVERSAQTTDDATIGVLYLDSRERGVLQSASARTALETLSEEAALAIENARLYREALEKAKFEQELKVAAGIQQALFPLATRVGDFYTTAAASVACRAVGGDFFDYVDLPSGHFGFILGDVAGKGPPAALLAAVLAGRFSVEATQQTSAAAVVARLNCGLCRRPIESRFFTAFYGIIASDGTLTFSNAGHNPPVLVTRTGVRRLETGGTVVGLFERASFEEETVTLAAGDVIVVFSDGVTEALNLADEEFTDERLVACIQAQRGRTPQEMLDGLFQDVRAFCGDATPSDDVTMLLVRYDGAGGGTAGT